MKYWALTFLFAFAPFSLIHAQETISAETISQSATLRSVPTTPGPNTETHIELSSSAIDLDIATITWSVNGTNIISGKGIKSVDIVTGKVGSRTVVTAKISLAGIEVIKTLTLTTGDVDIVWQGVTYTPPFYEGRSLWTRQSELVILAVPHVLNTSGTEIGSNNLIFRWSKNGTVLGTLSGTGKNTYTYVDTILSIPQTIKVEVLTDKNTVVAAATFTLNPTRSEALIYEDNPAYGFMFNREASAGFNLREAETSFQAFPLFFTVTNRDATSLVYNWTTGNASAGTNSRITFRAPDNASGDSRVSLRVGSNLAMQSAARNFLVQFGNENIF